MTRIAIVQSCYIPWRGYFDLIRRSDMFVLYDCVQYTPRDWRNRNRIKTAQGPRWLTVPVNRVSRTQRIYDTYCLDEPWQKRHWEALRHAYAKAPHFARFAPAVRELYASCASRRLSEVNRHFLAGIAGLFSIATPLVLLHSLVGTGTDKTQNILAVCKHYGATRYLSGPSAGCYLDLPAFEKAGIEVEYMRYEYPEYEQLHPPFLNQVSILDLLFSVGANPAELGADVT